MVYHICLYTDELLPLKTKKKFIDAMYRESYLICNREERNQGFINKFCYSIGFKPIMDIIDGYNVVHRAIVPSPDSYLFPDDLIHKHMQTPVDSFQILDFYLEDRLVEHPDARFSYQTKELAQKWTQFLRKVFPELNVKLDIVDEVPNKDLRTFAFEYFYRSIHWDIPYTIEFGSDQLLSEEDVSYILPKLQKLTKYPIEIRQFECETCQKNENKKYHIEVEYNQ